MTLKVWDPDLDEEERDIFARVYSFGTPRHEGSIFTEYLLNFPCSPDLFASPITMDIHSQIQRDLTDSMMMNFSPKIIGADSEFFDVQTRTTRKGRYVHLNVTMKTPVQMTTFTIKGQFTKIHEDIPVVPEISQMEKKLTEIDISGHIHVSPMEKRISDEWSLGLGKHFFGKVDTEPAPVALTIDKLKELRRSMGDYGCSPQIPTVTLKECTYRGYPFYIVNPEPKTEPKPPTERINPMKTSIIEIPFDNEGEPKPILVDIPKYCEIVHISGSHSCVYLRITTSDDVNENNLVAKAFFVVPGDMDLPGWVTNKEESRGRGEILPVGEDYVPPTYVRRLGKFTTMSGVLYFVFERRD